jgi:PAS domain S-box-containing protein
MSTLDSAANLPPQGRRVEISKLRSRLEELEETLRAIRTGEIDALIVSGAEGDQVFTLQGAEHPYRVLVESMNEGAATLNANGDLLYANRCFAEMLAIPLDQLIGSSLRELVDGIDHAVLDATLRQAHEKSLKISCQFLTGTEKRIPVHLSFSPLKEHDFHGICVIATDLTEQKRREAELAQEVGQRERAEEALRQEEISLRQLSGRLLRLQDEERRRIARDLHDSTGQKLVALTLELSMIEGQISSLPESVAKIFEDCRQLADDVSTDIRTLSYVLHPPLLDEAGLVSATRWFVDGFMRRSKIRVDLDLPEDLGRMPEELELTLFRILQESLTNVHRHAGSPTANVQVTIEGEKITLEVKDAGHLAGTGDGASGEKTGAMLGVGIRGMRERVRQLGGHLELHSTPQGTTMRATLPFQQLPPVDLGSERETA